MEKATLGGGCFWCLEAALQNLKGVEGVVSGYADGAIENPTYQQICTGTTGHAEVVQISFDNEIISFQTLLQIFFSIHDPTTLNRQGADTGTQYRSTILCHNDEQLSLAKEYIAQLDANGTWPNPIVTEVKPLDIFYEAEKYHQNYFQLNKVAKVKNEYQSYLK